MSLENSKYMLVSVCVERIITSCMSSSSRYLDVICSTKIFDLVQQFCKSFEPIPNFMNTQFPSLSGYTQIEGEEIIGIGGSNEGPKTG